MNRLKKLEATLIALGLTLGIASVSSAMPPASDETSPKKGWSIGLDALYVQTNNVSQVVLNSVSTPTSYTANYYDFQPDWQWGF